MQVQPSSRGLEGGRQRVGHDRVGHNMGWAPGACRGGSSRQDTRGWRRGDPSRRVLSASQLCRCSPPTPAWQDGGGDPGIQGTEGLGLEGSTASQLCCCQKSLPPPKPRQRQSVTAAPRPPQSTGSQHAGDQTPAPTPPSTPPSPTPSANTTLSMLPTHAHTCSPWRTVHSSA